jgi:hypothetical protein
MGTGLVGREVVLPRMYQTALLDMEGWDGGSWNG